MSIRFAAPRHALRARMDDAQARAACQRPANDNGSGHASDTMLTAALRHFSDHGLSAARHARLKAKAARRSGDEQGYRWWLDICRTLDRRMALELDEQATGS